MVIDIFVKADTAEQAAAIAHRNYPNLRFARTFAVDDGYDLSDFAMEWAKAHQSRRVDVVGTHGTYGYRINGEVR